MHDPHPSEFYCNIEQILTKHFRAVFKTASENSDRIYIATNGSCDAVMQDSAANATCINDKLRELATALGVLEDFGDSLLTCLNGLTLVSRNAPVNE